MTPSPRRRGRPSQPPEQQPTTRHCRVPASQDDALCRLSVQTGISINGLLLVAIAHFLTDADRILASARTARNVPAHPAQSTR